MVLSKHIHGLGYFATAEDWVRKALQARPGAKLAPIEPACGALPSIAQWMFDRCRAADQVELADCIRFLFGASKCTSFGENFALQDAIATA
jgi:hypothetical protein